MAPDNEKLALTVWKWIAGGTTTLLVAGFVMFGNTVFGEINDAKTETAKKVDQATYQRDMGEVKDAIKDTNRKLDEIRDAVMKILGEKESTRGRR